MSDVGLAFLPCGGAVRRSRFAAPVQNRAGDVEFVDFRPAGQFLHRLTVTVACREVLAGINADRVVAQLCLDEADLLVEPRPVDCRQYAQAGDAIADRDLIRRLPFALVPQRLFHGNASLPQPPLDGVEPLATDRTAAKVLQRRDDEMPLFGG